jgi:tetratricopeptide (TPR) repeat protein
MTGPETSRVPLTLQTAFERIHLGAPTSKPEEALQRVQLHDLSLQDPRPLTSCLEWELSELVWSQAGVLPFVENDVPFLINNSGRLSEHCAALLFAACVEVPPSGPFSVLELGAGTGLFARYFLDAFRTLCVQEGRDFYQRLVYHVTDRSTRTIDQWRERKLFGDHPASVVRPGTCDAMAPGRIEDESGSLTAPVGLRAVFCNYILDSLPATVVRKGADGPEELLIRTHLVEDRSILAQYTSLDPDAVRALARSDDPADRIKLLPLISLLEPEALFVPVSEPSELMREALEGVSTNERAMVNYGAVACIRACLELLDPAGMLLVNDYGPVRGDQVSGHGLSQRFGPTSASSLNFPLLERHFGASLVFDKAEGDEQRGIHSRLVLKAPLPSTQSVFHDRFGPAGAEYFEAPLDEARKHVSAGRKNEALEAYRTALSRSPRDWQLTGEIAEFVGLMLQDASAGRDLVRAALEQNPWYSPWLWNVLGDIQFIERDFRGAHEAYLQAQRIHPMDERTNLNLAFTYFEFGDYAAALEAIARSFASDVRGVLRPRLLEKQHQVLGAVSTRWLGEQERLVRRTQRLS